LKKTGEEEKEGKVPFNNDMKDRDQISPVRKEWVNNTNYKLISSVLY
jgi:hypothetical protein